MDASIVVTALFWFLFGCSVVFQGALIRWTVKENFWGTWLWAWVDWIQVGVTAFVVIIIVLLQVIALIFAGVLS